MVRDGPPLGPLPPAGGDARGVERSPFPGALQAPLPQAGGVGGGLFRKRALDGRDNAFQILQDVVVPETDNAPALRFEIAGSGFVIGGACIMLAAIYFDDQPFGARGEVRDIPADRHLPVEAHPGHLASRQRPPQSPFRIGRIETQFPGLSCRSVFAEGPGTLPSVPSRLREGLRLGRRAVPSTEYNRLPSRRREGLGEGATFPIRTIHQPHSPS